MPSLAIRAVCHGFLFPDEFVNKKISPQEDDGTKQQDKKPVLTTEYYTIKCNHVSGRGTLAINNIEIYE